MGVFSSFVGGDYQTVGIVSLEVNAKSQVTIDTR